MKEKTAVPLVSFIVLVLGAVSLITLLGDPNQTGLISQAQKEVPKLFVTPPDCQFPSSTADLMNFLGERKNKPFTMDTCKWIAQDFCVVLNSGSCLKQCLKIVQSKDGVCSGSSSVADITAQVVLTPEECKRLAMSYDNSNVKALTTVGAGTQVSPVENPCIGSSESSASRVYSVDEPLQAYARNLFESGDITGYLVNENEGQPALEYVLCKDGRSRVNIEGRTRCDDM